MSECVKEVIMSIRAHAKKVARISGLPYCRCLQRMRKCDSLQARRDFVALVKKKYARLDRKSGGLPSDEGLEDLEDELGF